MVQSAHATRASARYTSKSRVELSPRLLPSPFGLTPVLKALAVPLEPRTPIPGACISRKRSREEWLLRCWARLQFTVNSFYEQYAYSQAGKWSEQMPRQTPQRVACSRHRFLRNLEIPSEAEHVCGACAVAGHKTVVAGFGAPARAAAPTRPMPSALARPSGPLTSAPTQRHKHSSEQVIHHAASLGRAPCTSSRGSPPSTAVSAPHQRGRAAVDMPAGLGASSDEALWKRQRVGPPYLTAHVGQGRGHCCLPASLALLFAHLCWR